MVLVVLIGFGTALAAPLVHRLLPRWSGWLCALVPSLLFAFFAAQIGEVAAGHPARFAYPWIPSLAVELSFLLDGLSLLFALLITGIGVLVVVYASAYLHGHRHLGRFYGLILAFMAAMLGTVLAGDLLTLFVFWELTGLCSYLLIGFDHGREAARKAALQALLVTGAGGLALLAGVLLLGQAAGSTDLSALLTRGDLVRAHPLYLPVLLLVLAGAFAKSAQFPFHFWLPGAMEAPTPVSAYLHSATMVKLGVYLLARLSPVLGGTEAWHHGLTLAGGATMLVGGALALLRTDLKQILAYSTVSSLGLLTLLLGLDTQASVTAAMVFLGVHALYKSALFLVAGAVDHGAGTRELPRLGGLARAMPWVALGAGLASLSMAGVPPLAGFVAKELLYEAKLHAPLAAPLVAGIGVATNMLAVAVAVLVGYLPFFGRRPDPPPGHHRVGALLWLPPLVPALAGAVVGVVPGLTGRALVAPAVAAVRGGPVAVDLALWHGMSPVLLLGVVTVAGGLGLAAVRGRLVDRLAGWKTSTGWGPERGYGLVLGGMLALARWQTRVLQNGRLRYYLMTAVGAAVCLMGGVLFLRAGLPGELPRPEGGLHEWLAAALVLGGALTAAVTTSRLTAVAAVGTVGYGVALIYILYGSPDLAMTQFCIETLSIILFVLVLYRLPRFSLLSGPAGRARDVAVALSIGALMTLLVLLTVSRTLEPHVSAYYLAQSLPAGHGRNVVNVILVDFRALDTLGEITVLAVAALGVHGLVKMRRGEEG
ncbi:MAG: putative monovalent cation/H+ antiporter subunit A [Deltaproteobacteria bacterium]|nr:putative monovalent cation/H+ antiporter subunit A [Deltaproteobacteria bacterium]